MMIPDYATRQRLISRVIQLQDCQSSPDDPKALRRLILNVVLEHYAGTRLGLIEIQSIVDRLFAAMRGLDLLQPLLEDDTVTEIMVNGPKHIFIERGGRIVPWDDRFDHTEHLTAMISRFFGLANRLINEHHPIGDMRLPDGGRLHAVLPPAAPEGPVLSIRKFTGIRPDVQALLTSGFLTPVMSQLLENAVRTRRNIFISGGTGTGKTTFLNALSAFIPTEERIITIEDSAELDLQNQPNQVRLEAHPPAPDGSGELTLSDLVRSALRMRPDRILVGEVRGREVFPMLQAMNTGHPGSMSTGHANSAHEMLQRLGLLVLLEVSLPWDAIVRLVSSALDLIIQLERTAEGQRRVAEICQIGPPDGTQFRLEVIASHHECLS